MSLPDTLRVRISSESVESVGITPVVSQLMPAEELAATILGVTGKDAPRVRDILARGSFVVAGSSRFQWEKFDAVLTDVEKLLSKFPDPDPSLAFDAALCTEAVLYGLGSRPLVIEREAGKRRRLFRRESFWDRLMQMAAAVATYKTYSYRERADIFAGIPDTELLRDAAKLLAWSSFEQQIRRGVVSSMELRLPRR
jgi:hypothetical protein